MNSFYKKIGGGLETVKQTIAAAAKVCHVEVTTLVIPGENDTHQEMRRSVGLARRYRRTYTASYIALLSTL